MLACSAAPASVPGRFHVYVAVKGGLRLTIDEALASGELFVAAAERAAHHCQRIPHRDQPGDRAGKHARWRDRGTGRSGSPGPDRRRLCRAAIRAAYATVAPAHATATSPPPNSTDVLWRSAAAPRARSPRGARDAADRKIHRRAGDGGQVVRRKRDCRRRVSCICSRKRPASRSARSAPGSARGICCTSPTRTSTSRISRRTSAIPIPPISATRSAASTA